MFTYAFLLGRNQELSLAELFSLNAKFKIQNSKWTDELALLEFEHESEDPQALLNRLGGTIKILKVEREFKNLSELAEVLKEELRKRTSASKFNFGISSYLKQKLPRKLGIYVKQDLKREGFSLRFVASQEPLTSVQVAKNKLTDQGKGVEFNLLERDRRLYLAVTKAVQDFESYSKRDYDKPGRAARLGMLPPKLAQIMLNLAGVKPRDTVLDPFCGTGTVLMEALLMGADVFASDIDESQVRRTAENLEWLNNNFVLENGLDKVVKQVDAQNLARELRNGEVCGKNRENCLYIVSEGYLGPPQEQVPSLVESKRIFAELTKLYTAVFKEYAKILKKGEKVVMTLPYFRTNGKDTLFAWEQVLKFSAGFKLLNPLKGFREPRRPGLKYARPDQIVGREVFVWEKLLNC